ncbi:MAG: ATP-binding protein [Actinobacteria bacterium]|nr:ATP-binding protein [Actinomycetota bacterium]
MSETMMAELHEQERDGVRSIRLRIPSKAEYVALARLALTGLAELASMPEETVADLKLALTEAVSNSVRHAYVDGEGWVEIAYALTHDRLEVEVYDDGPGFDPDGPAGGVDDDDEDLAEGGLGIAIIRTIVDELQIQSQPGVRGSRLRFVKRLQ